MTDSARFLKINSCAECDYRYKKIEVILKEYCRKTHEVINKYVKAKTIHPDCPLDKIETMIQPVLDVWEEVVDIHAHERGLLYWHKKMKEAIRKTIKLNAEGEGEYEI